MKSDNLQKQNSFSHLVSSGFLAADTFQQACQTAADNNLPLSLVLMREYGLQRSALQQALAKHYHCPVIEYDERLPVPPELSVSRIPLPAEFREAVTL